MTDLDHSRHRNRPIPGGEDVTMWTQPKLKVITLIPRATEEWEQEFERIRNLRERDRPKGSRPYLCAYCRRTFATLDGRRFHEEICDDQR